MDWIVKKVGNVDAERQHLNKILAEIRSAINSAESTTTTNVIERTNTRYAVGRFTLSLDGDVSGSAEIDGLNDVTLTTTLGDLPYVEEAPLDAQTYWRSGGEWEAVSDAIIDLESIEGNGFTVIYEDADHERRWATREIEGTANNIVVTDGTGVDGNPIINLAAVVDSNTGTLQGITVDGFGRVTGTTDATITGTLNRITVANGNAAAGVPTIDIAATYVGQTSITTLGTIGTGVWQGTIVAPAFLGTGSPDGTNFLRGDGTWAIPTGTYTDETAQDAIGAMVDSTLVYSDATPSLGRAAISGDITIPSGSNTAAITAGVIVNADVNASAAIAVSKLAALTASRAVATDGSGFLTVAATTAAELDFVNGVTSAIQTQLNNKQPLDTQLTSLAALAYAGNGGKFVRLNAGETDFEFAAAGGSSPLTTKGDIYVYSTADDRLPVGTDGYVLSADSTTATGLKWVVATSGSGDVVGPASSVDNRVVFFDGVTGKLIKDSGLTLSGSNTGDQTITLTGDVTGSGTGSFATTLATAQPAVHTWALAQTFTVAPVFTDQSGTRTALGLGTAATHADTEYLHLAATAETVAGGLKKFSESLTLIDTNDDGDASLLFASSNGITGTGKGWAITSGSTNSAINDLTFYTWNGTVFAPAAVLSASQLTINGSVALTALTGQPLDAQLTSLAGLSYTGNGLKVVRVNAGETDFELANPDAVYFTVSQAAHGLSVGKAVQLTGSSWAVADRDVGSTVADAIVSAVADANNFTVTTVGKITLTTGQWDAVTGDSGGLTAGEYYWLSSTAGGLTKTQPTSGIAQCLGVALSTTVLLVNIGDAADVTVDAEIAALAGLTSAADKVPYFTGSGTAALADFTAGGRALVNSAGTADTFPYFSASNTVTLASITAAGRALLDDAAASNQRTTLGVGAADSPSFAAVTVDAGALRVDRAGDTAAAQVLIDRDAGQVGQLLFRTGTSARWIINANGSAEGGANAGTNWELLARADDGTALFTVISAVRSTGIMTFSGTPLFPTATAGDNSTKGATTAYFRTNSANSSYRNIFERECSHTAGRVNGTYAIGSGDAAPISGTGTLYPWGVFYYDPADHPTLDGLAPKLRIRGQVVVNDTAPTSTFVIALHPVTHTGATGGAGLNLYTIGAAVAGSAATTITTPAADSLNQVVGSDFAAPTAGWYCLGFVQSTATVAANSHLHIAAQLQMRNA